MITTDKDKPMIKRRNFSNSKVITKAIVVDICERLVKQQSTVSIAKQLDVPLPVVYNIKARKRHTNISRSYGWEPVGSGRYGTIRTICKRLQAGDSIVNISRGLGVTFKLIKDIRDRKAHTYISKPYTWPVDMDNISISTIQEICTRLEAGEETADIAFLTSVPKHTVSRIKHRKIYKAISSDYKF